MKGYLFFVLSLISIVSFGQSDLEIKPNYVANGLTSSKNYRYNYVRWSFDAINNGTTDAGIVTYEVYLSRDDSFDPNDLLVHQGNLGDDNLNSPSSGIDSGKTVEVSSDLVTEKHFYVPWNYEANEQYYFFFKIKQDFAGEEVNIANNIAVLPFYLTLDDKLSIQHVDYTVDLGNKTPLILVHGWQPEGYDADGNTSIWDNFLEYFKNDPDLVQNFKPYYVKYNSNVVPVNDLGHELRIDLDNWFGTDYTGNINIVAHSMGGLVARSFMNRERSVGPHQGDAGGERVNKLITLGTPHHGSPMANGPIRLQANTNSSYLISSFFLNALDNNLYGLFLVGSTAHNESNRWDLRWDNYDGYWSEGIYSTFVDEHNSWLNSDKMNLNTDYDNRIIAYGGYITNRSYLSVDSKKYFITEVPINHLGFPLNDGIVPFNSATFEEHNLDKIRFIPNRYHDEMAKGRFDYVTDTGTDQELFNFIKIDLLNNVSNAYITALSNTNFNYQDTALGDNSSKEIIIQNTGDIPLTISSIQLVGVDNSQFKFNFPSVPYDIQPNETDTLTVDFVPTTIGNKSVVFRINNSSVNEPQLDIQLSGLAVETATTDFKININDTYNFGSVYIYEGTKLVYTSISNSGSASYTVDSLHIKGSNANLFKIVQQPKFPKDFEPGDLEPLILSFDPDTVGEKNAIIEAYFKDSSILDSANLVGNGIKTYADPNSSKLSFYEYWFNYDYAGKKSIQLSNSNSFENLIFSVNTNHIKKGLNTIHFRFKDDNNHWSSVVSNFVYIQKTESIGENKISKYRYWFNDNFQNNIVKDIEAQVKILINGDLVISDLENNSVNHIHFQFKDSNGSWSSVITEEFLFETTLDNENFGVDKFNLYPNPSNSKVYLSTKINKGQLFVYDSLGKLIKKFSSLPTNVDVSCFKSGLYIFKIESENRIYQEKVIKF